MLGKITDAATSTRWRDAINALHAGKSVITKTGVDEYPGSSLNKPGLEPKKLYKIYRPPEVIEAALPLMKHLRILDGHHFETADNLKDDKLVGTTGDAPEMKDGAAYINVTIWKDGAIKEIEAGTKEQFSLGYSFDVEMTPGTTPDGRHYDGRFTKIIPEHVALVPVGRVNHPGNTGPLAKIADEANMNFQEAMTAICQTCPDTPADVVRAAVWRTLAALNTQEAKEGPEPAGTRKTGDDTTPPKEKEGELSGVSSKGLAKMIADALNNLFMKKETTAVADEEAEKQRKEREKREDRMARDMLMQMKDKPSGKVRACLEAMDLTEAARRVLTEDEQKGKTGDAPGYRHTQNDLFGGTSTNTISGGGHGRGGWNHDSADPGQAREDEKEKRMKAARLEAKELLDKGLHEEAVKTHLMKARGLSGEAAAEMVERSRHIPSSELPKSKTKDEEAERREEIRKEVEAQRKKEREEEEERRKKADKARDEVEKEVGRLHGCKVGDSADHIYRTGLSALGFFGAETLHADALESTFRSFASQRSRMTTHVGDSAAAGDSTADINGMALALLG